MGLEEIPESPNRDAAKAKLMQFTTLAIGWLITGL
jgi:hypothetical protein